MIRHAHVAAPSIGTLLNSTLCTKWFIWSPPRFYLSVVVSLVSGRLTLLSCLAYKKNSYLCFATCCIPNNAPKNERRLCRIFYAVPYHGISCKFPLLSVIIRDSYTCCFVQGRPGICLSQRRLHRDRMSHHPRCASYINWVANGPSWFSRFQSWSLAESVHSPWRMGRRPRLRYLFNICQWWQCRRTYSFHYYSRPTNQWRPCS